jgi:hypothetical protein
MSDTEPTDTQPKPSDSEQLGDAGKAALQAERKRANDAEKALNAATTRLKELEDAGKSELEKAQARIAELEASNTTLTADLAARDITITRLNVGIDEGLPKNLIARLQGADEESIKADAASLRELVPDNTPSPFPKADPSQGRQTEGQQSTAQQFAAFAEAALK